jgi:HEAT repeat protein
MGNHSARPDGRLRIMLDTLRALVQDDLRTVLSLVESGDADTLPQLLAYAATRNDTVAAEAARGIARIAGPQSPRELLESDRRVRCRFWWVAYSNGRVVPRLTPEDVPRLGRHGVLPLGVASMHPDGYVREAAVRELDLIGTGEELKYLLVRLNDWVEPVRQRALDAVRRRLTPAYAPHLIRDLRLVEHLAECGRDDHETLIAEAHALLRTTGRTALAGGVESADVWTRRACFRLLLDLPCGDAADVVERARVDADNVIRLHAVRWAALLLERERFLEWLPLLVHDPFAPVRQHALRLWAERAPGTAAGALRAALLDGSAAVRDQARRTLARQGVEGFADVYRSALATNPLPALRGLRETGDLDDAPRVFPFLGDGRVRVREAAVAALATLAPDVSVELLMSALEDENARVSKAARRGLEGRVAVLAESLWRMVEGSGREHVRVNALRLLESLGKWQRITWLLRARVLRDERVADEALAGALRWMNGFNRAAAQPTAEEMERARRALDEAERLLRADDLRKLRFLMTGYER